MLRKRSWSLPSEPSQTVEKAELHPKKVMLWIWLDYRGPIYYELLPINETNAEKHSGQLDILKAVMKKNAHTEESVLRL